MTCTGDLDVAGMFGYLEWALLLGKCSSYGVP